MKAASSGEKSEFHLCYLLNSDWGGVDWPAFSGSADQLMWSGLVSGGKTAKILNGVRFLQHLLKTVLRKGKHLACLEGQKINSQFKACVPIWLKVTNSEFHRTNGAQLIRLCSGCSLHIHQSLAEGLRSTLTPIEHLSAGGYRLYKVSGHQEGHSGKKKCRPQLHNECERRGPFSLVPLSPWL